MGDGRGHGAAQVDHQRAQAQLPEHHVADQGRRHPRRQGGERMGPVGFGTEQQQLGVRGRGPATGLRRGAGGGDSRHGGRIRGGQQQQDLGFRPAP